MILGHFQVIMIQKKSRKISCHIIAISIFTIQQEGKEKVLPSRQKEVKKIPRNISV